MFRLSSNIRCTSEIWQAHIPAASTFNIVWFIRSIVPSAQSRSSGCGPTTSEDLIRDQRSEDGSQRSERQDGNTGIGFQSHLPVGASDTYRFYAGLQKRRYSERRHRCYK